MTRTPARRRRQTADRDRCRWRQRARPRRAARPTVDLPPTSAPTNPTDARSHCRCG